MKIMFFNHWGHGDIHVSRGFVRKIIEKVKSQDSTITFAYSHQKDPVLLSDIPNLEFDPIAHNNVGRHDNLSKIDNCIYINTWYAQQNHKYMNQYGITIDSLYAALDDTCKLLWQFSLSDISVNISDFFPTIDYSNFNLDNIKNWIQQHPNKKILIENGDIRSGQSINFPMVPIINRLAQKHKDKVFILSRKENIILQPNVFYTDDIIKKQGGSDLNEVSFLSSNCDMIIGRASGVFSFTITKENLFDRKIKYLCFSNLTPLKSNKFWLGPLLQDKVNYNSNIDVYNIYNPNSVEQIIDNSL